MPQFFLGLFELIDLFAQDIVQSVDFETQFFDPRLVLGDEGFPFDVGTLLKPDIFVLLLKLTNLSYQRMNFALQFSFLLLCQYFLIIDLFAPQVVLV